MNKGMKIDRTLPKPGDRFGQLTVIEKSLLNNQGRVLWLCRCDCGELHTSLATKLRKGRVTRCLKCAKRAMGNSKQKFHPGDRFGKLVLIERLGKRGRYRCDCGAEHFALLKKGVWQCAVCTGKNRATTHQRRRDGEVKPGDRFGSLVVIAFEKGVWKCVCDCGRRVQHKHSPLRLGYVTRCLRCGVRAAQAKKAKADAAITRAFAVYRSGARKRNIPFEITYDHFAKLTQQPCFWCGAMPRLNGYSKRALTKRPLNGVDRVDSSKAYSNGNAVPCCSVCNIMKREFTPAQFLQSITNIYQHAYRNDWIDELIK